MWFFPLETSQFSCGIIVSSLLAEAGKIVRNRIYKFEVNNSVIWPTSLFTIAPFMQLKIPRFSFSLSKLKDLGKTLNFKCEVNLRLLSGNIRFRSLALH